MHISMSPPFGEVKLEGHIVTYPATIGQHCLAMPQSLVQSKDCKHDLLSLVTHTYTPLSSRKDIHIQALILAQNT